MASHRKYFSSTVCNPATVKPVNASSYERRQKNRYFDKTAEGG